MGDPGTHFAIKGSTQMAACGAPHDKLTILYWTYKPSNVTCVECNRRIGDAVHNATARAEGALRGDICKHCGVGLVLFSQCQSRRCGRCKPTSNNAKD